MHHSTGLEHIWLNDCVLSPESLTLQQSKRHLLQPVMFPGSLTVMLSRVFEGNVQACPLIGSDLPVTPAERKVLELGDVDCTVREVELLVNGVARVYARTILPRVGRVVEIESWLKAHNGQPLGKLIFDDSDTQSTIVGYGLSEAGVTRRRLIVYRNTPMCITEYFLYSDS